MERFLVTQKLTAVINRYTIETEARVPVAFVEQKRFSFREQVVFYSDLDKRQPLFRFKARSVMDLGATYDVIGPDERPIGLFRKDFTKSLLRSTWHLEPVGSGRTITGQERSQGVAIGRRVWEVIPYTEMVPFAIPYHFDFVDDGHPIFSVNKKVAIRDRYVLEFHEPTLDRRLGFAMAVALDALQSR